MTDTRKDFEEWKVERDIQTNNSPIMPFEILRACQSLNDKRIQQLLAVIEAKDALMSQCIESNLHLADGDICTLKLIKKALAIKPEYVELVEVGYTSMPSLTNLSNGNDVIVGKKSDLRTEPVYTIKTKE